MLKRDGRGMPAYRQLAALLRDSTAKHLGSAAQRLPTEAELSRRYGVSRQTVRRAYLDLVADGLVRRTPGRGTYPTPVGQYLRSSGSLEDLLALAIDTEFEVVRPLRVVPHPAESVFARLGADAVMEVCIRRFHAGVPFSVTVLSFPLGIGRKLRRYTFLRKLGARRRTTILELLDAVLDPPIMVAKQIITVTEVPVDVAELIDCAAGDPVLQIDRLFCDTGDRAIVLAVNYFNPTRYAYRLELKRTVTPRPARRLGRARDA